MTRALSRLSRRSARETTSDDPTAGRPPAAGGTVADLPDPAAALLALAQRLRAVAAVLIPDPVPAALADASDAPASDAPAHQAGQLLDRVVDTLLAEPSDDRIWLALAGLCGALPTRDDVDEVRRSLELAAPGRASIELLAWALPVVRSAGAPLATAEIAVGRVVVDVDFTARHDLHTGIQRVVRQTVPLWQQQHDVVPVAWTSGRGAMRELASAEAARVFQWSADKGTAGGQEWAPPVITSDDQLVIPWRSVVVVPEVPQPDITPRLAALAAVSGNRMVAVGHDAIPLLSADTLDLAEPDKYMAYLAALKYATRVAGVSRSSTAEFAAFADMLAAQGLSGPIATAVPLPVDFAVRDLGSTGGAGPRAGTPGSDPDDGIDHGPEVVVVGSHDVRKNHQAVLHAAELLWQRGLRFRLSFIGSGGSNRAFLDRIDTLVERGRDVRLRTGLSDAQLRTAVAQARFTVFPSLHEGYGLPVAESLALGTPVVTTSYGSTAEIATDGGALVVDPRDDAALAAAMGDLLTDDALHARLCEEITRRPERTWSDYAAELWTTIVEPELAAAQSAPRPGTGA